MAGLTFKEFIRQLPCCVCHQGTWNGELGQWQNTVSHVKKRSTRNDQPDEGNCVPMDVFCHSQYEGEVPKRRERFRSLAIDLWEQYKTKYESDTTLNQDLTRP